MTEAHAPRPDKVAVVEEITAKLKEARAVFVSEYRGISVGQLADQLGTGRANDLFELLCQLPADNRLSVLAQFYRHIL